MGRSNRLQQAFSLFDAAVARPVAEREAFLASACGADAALHEEVRSLLEAHAEAGGCLSFSTERSVAASMTGAGQHSPVLVPGMRLGVFTIETFVGAGGMGQVYKARDTRLDRHVAIKVLAPEAARDPRSRARFTVEARAIARLSHPRIGAIHDIVHHDDLDFLVMEFLDGETLAAKLRREPVSVADGLATAIEIGEALAAAHDRGIVHRDLKPGNIMITPSGAKLLDFGLARLRGGGEAGTESAPMSVLTQSHTAPGLIVGTLHYMAPEQLEGKDVDARADIFAFGVVLYELLTGQKPFDATTQAGVITAILSSEPQPVTELQPQVPASLERVLRSCLEKDRDARSASMRDVLVQLEGIAHVRPDDQHLHTSRTDRSHWVWPAGATLLALVVAGLTALAKLGSHSPPLSPITSLALLPVENYSPQPLEAYFADSMTEAMIGDLARISNVTVTPRTSVMRYKSTTKTTKEIARELGVDGLIEASFMKAGTQVVINATLVDARTDRRIWSQRYEREMQDVLVLQSEVARAISKEISATLSPQGQHYLDEARLVDPAAHDAYLRGRYELNRSTEESLYSAIRHFEGAIARDPGSARAYAGLADSYSMLRGMYVPPQTVMPKARQAARKAVELDGSLAEARVTLANVLMFYDWDWQASEREFKHAIGLNPNLASARQGYALLLVVVGRTADAFREMERALHLDPVSPLVRNDAAWMYYLDRRYDLVVEMAKAAIELDPGFWPGHMLLGLGFEKLGEHGKAMEALQKARSLDDSPAILEMLGGLYATMGKTAEARMVLAELDAQSKRRYVCPYEVATIHAGLGDRAATVQWLEKGRRDRADCLPWAGVDPKLDLLRNDKEFQDLLQRAGIHRTPPS